MSWCFILGIIPFSFSIYGLVISDVKGKKLKFSGPITPISEMFLIIGWRLLIKSIVTIDSVRRPPLQTHSITKNKLIELTPITLTKNPPAYLKTDGFKKYL